MRIGELASKAGVNIQSVRARLLAMIDRIETVSSVGCPGEASARFKR